MANKKRKHTKRHLFIAEVVGWTGVAAYIVAYFLLVLGVFNDQTIAFHAMYLVGAIGIVYHSYVKHDVQPVIVNVFFGTVAFLAIAKVTVL